MKRTFSFLFIVLSIAGLGLLLWRNHQSVAQIGALHARLLAVQTDNGNLKQALSAEGKTNNSDEAIRRELEKAVEQIHLLKFKQPIKYRTMKSSDFKAFISAKISELYSTEELKNDGRAMALLGLVPEGTDIGQIILKLYNEQVAAFYEQHKGELYTFSDFSLSENVDRMMLSHEMTHALQDQNFTLKNFPLETKTNDDLALATSALVEGDATLLMTLWYMQHVTEAFDLRSLFKDLGSMLGQNTEQLAQSPQYFRDTLLFPYQQGNEFVFALYQEGGYGAINKAFEKRPVSTEQILHPAKYTEGEAPIDVQPPDLKISGWKKIFVNVLGELGTRILLEQNIGRFEANRAAQGWGGDRYEVFQDSEGNLSLLWVTVWDTETDAREFHEAFDAAAHKRTGLTAAKHATGETGFSQFGSERLQVAIRKAALQVTIVLGPRKDVSAIVSALSQPGSR